MPQPVGWIPTKPPPLPSTPIADPPTNTPPEIQARHLVAQAHTNPASSYLPYLQSFTAPTTSAWPRLLASCLHPTPCPSLHRVTAALTALPRPPDTPELLPEPLRSRTFRPPPAGYVPRPSQRDAPPARSLVEKPVVRKPDAPEFVKLGTGLQPSISRRRAVGPTNLGLPKVKSLFLSGRKSARARAAEEKEKQLEMEREEKEREKEREKEKEKEKENEQQHAQGDPVEDANPDYAADPADAPLDLELDITIEDAAEIERMEGMNEEMIRTQRHKEARPRNVGAIVRKMHSTTTGVRNIVAATDDGLPAPTDTAYARGLRRDEAVKKRHAQVEAARERERAQAEQRQKKFNRMRKRKLRKAGRKLSENESDAEETASVPEEASQSADLTVDITNTSSAGPGATGRMPQRRRVEPPEGHVYGQSRPDDRYDPQYDRRRRQDDRPPWHPPQDGRRYDERPPPNWSPPHPYPPPPSGHYSSPPSGHYSPPSPYYAPPSPYYTYPHPPPHYQYPHGPPPQHYYPSAPPPRRLDRPVFERRKQELTDQIGGMCSQLHQDDATMIDDFLDNQDYMFRGKERTKYILLEQNQGQEVLLRIDRETREWQIVRRPGN